MKIRSVIPLTLCLAFAGSGSLFNLHAQDAAAASTAATDRCVHWMKTTVPGVFDLEPTDFCSGRYKYPGPGGWWSLHDCGQPSDQVAGAAPKYCASSGQISKSEAWAVGFSSKTIDGRELLDGNADTTGHPGAIAATFYSRTPVWIGNLRLLAGMYDLTPAKSEDGWELFVSRQEGESVAGAKQSVGKIVMNAVEPNSNATGRASLAITTSAWAERCPGPALDWSLRELHFIYGNTDLFVCVRPDQILKNQEENLTQR
jgi:hypothetical protein